MNDDVNGEILDDLYPATGAGPGRNLLIGMVRAHRAEQRRRRQATAIAALAAFGAVAFLLSSRGPKPAQPLAANPPSPRHQISDDELLDMVGQSAAIATLPDGTQRLLVVMQTHPPSGR